MIRKMDMQNSNITRMTLMEATDARVLVLFLSIFMGLKEER
jgi:hypothetical protein